MTPYTYKNYYKDLFDNFEVIFQTNSIFVVPDVGLRAIIKYICSSYFHKNSIRPSRFSNKFLGLPIDFYLLKKIN